MGGGGAAEPPPAASGRPAAALLAACGPHRAHPRGLAQPVPHRAAQGARSGSVDDAHAGEPGEQRIVDTAGRVERFQKKYANKAAANKK